MAKFTCPFCILEYDIKKVEYVCPDCGRASEPGFLERRPIKCKYNDCGHLATIRRCPNCSASIPDTALETPNLPFSIVGVSNSGKTNYITVMLHELSKTAGLGLSLAPQTKDTRDHQNENRKAIYDRHTPPPGTEAGAVAPQIWYIKNLKKKSGQSVPTYTFTVFDGAGEDHENNLDSSSPVGRYINASKAIILVIDPLVLSSVRHGGVVDPNVLRNSLGGDEGESKQAEEVINSVAAYIKNARGIKTSQVLNIPVAVVLTKFDTVLNHPGFAPNALVKNASLTVRDGKVDMTEIRQVHEEIQNWLYSIDEGGFVNALQSHFKEFYFFGVSSYGSPPKSVGTLVETIRPHRVLDPILWLFKRERFID